jgi:glycosyltransferase involved in cell wall biosynthesis
MRPQPGLDVAVFAPFAGALYEPEPGPAGGAEIQSAYLVRALAERGFRVGHIVAGERLVGSTDGVEVLAMARYGAGGLARRRAIVSALHAANARVYIQRSAGFETGIVGLYARSRRRRFIFSSSSSGDFSRDRRVAIDGGSSLHEWPSRIKYLAGLRLVNTIVVQTEEQRALARAAYGVDPRVIRSFCPPAPVMPQTREAFLWIGGLVGSKNPLAYVELARRLPESAFWMVTGDREGWADLSTEVRSLADSTPNLQLLPQSGREDVLALYARAVAVVSTSRFEGFPNVFLEGWTRGTPALSLSVDPDRTIERFGLGAACNGSLDELEAAARRLWEGRFQIDSQLLRAYIEDVHDPRIVGGQWAELIEELLDR